MSEQLEPELERVARMLAAAGPLPDAPATLRERALRIPDGGSAPEQEGSAPEQEAAAVPIARRRFRRPRPIALAGLARGRCAVATSTGPSIRRRVSVARREHWDAAAQPVRLVEHRPPQRACARSQFFEIDTRAGHEVAGPYS